MIKVLALHKRDISDKEFLNLLYNRYPTLQENKDIWKIYVYKVGSVYAKKTRVKYDRIYYDKQSLTISDITSIIVSAGQPQVIEIDFEHERIAEKRKLSTFVVSKGEINESTPIKTNSNVRQKGYKSYIKKPKRKV